MIKTKKIDYYIFNIIIINILWQINLLSMKLKF